MKIKKMKVKYNHLCRKPHFGKYLNPLKWHRNGFVFKICVWISVFRRKKQFENSILSSQDIKQKPSLIFLGHPVESSLVLISSCPTTTHQD